jgi:hypothetical protein
LLEPVQRGPSSTSCAERWEGGCAARRHQPFSVDFGPAPP